MIYLVTILPALVAGAGAAIAYRSMRKARTCRDQVAAAMRAQLLVAVDGAPLVMSSLYGLALQARYSGAPGPMVHLRDVDDLVVDVAP